jgi:threonine dehydrogenase-like Zn-dependent dehydrogenase
VVVDSISGPESMATAHACVRPGGTIACLGMDHFMGKTPTINWFDQFTRNISVTGGLVPGKRYIPELLGLLEAGAIDPAPMISHRLSLEGAADGYRMMADRTEGVTKVALRPGS